LLADPRWLGKITADPNIFARVNIAYPDGRYTKLKIYISDLILGNCKYITAADIKINFII